MSLTAKPDLRPKQAEAVTAEASQVVVLAGAGSGKTRVLVDRYLRLVLGRGLSPRRILAATFTEKAASEMKERVARELTSADRPDLVAELNAAPICTLHGFCSRLITPHTLKLGLDPAYRILDSHEAGLLQEEILTGVLARWRQNQPEQLETIVSGLHWSGDFNLRSGRPPSSRGFSRQFLDLVEAVRCAGKAVESPFMALPGTSEEIRNKAQTLLAQLRDLLAGIGSKAPAAQENARLACACLERYLANGDPCHPEVPRILKDLRALNLRGRSDFSPLLKALKEEICPQILDDYHRPRYEAVRGLLSDLFIEFLAAYQAEKMRLGSVDFLDLEEKALQILSWDHLSDPVDEVLIDESQDLNPVQWQIIRRLTATAPLFVVGDVQQSIYGFRYAEVEIFKRMAASTDENGGKVILLDENFRSRSSVLGAVNSLFEGVWAEGSPVSFLRLQAQYPYPPQRDDFPELLLAEGPDREAARQAEAELLVRRLAELIRGGQFQVHQEQQIEGQRKIVPRTPRWGDALVLVRSTTGFAPLELAFHKLGVPFLIQAGRGFWDALEIADLMALLRSLEDPGDSFSLACLLKSPAVGFSDDDLTELRLGRDEEEIGWKPRPLYSGLKVIANSKSSEGSLSRRAAAFLDLFDRLFVLKDHLPLRRLLEIWIAETGLMGMWSGQKEGSLKISNIRKFLRLCDGQAGQSLSRLRAAFEEIRLREVREAEAPSPASGEGAVRVMTVHGAKGLEAPLVAVYDLNYAPRGHNGAFAYDLEQQAGFCLEDPQSDKGVHKPGLYTAICQAKSDREEAENLRVLYVALTRAREKLILSASCTRGKNDSFRAMGWFKTFLDRYNLDPNQLFDPAVIPSGYLQVGDLLGAPQQYLLIRDRDDRPLPDLTTTEVMTATGLPAGFPVPPEPGLEAISVVEYLQEGGSFPVDFHLAEDGALLSDEESEGGIELGRWVHRLLEVLPWDLPESAWREYACREAKLLFRREADEREISDALRLTANFLRSPLAAQVKSAHRVLKEFPILFQTRGALLRGKLDLAFQTKSDPACEEASGWTLVDYKSDRRVSEERLAAYRAQLELYAEGWEGLTGTRPRAVLFLLNEAREVNLE